MKTDIDVLGPGMFRASAIAPWLSSLITIGFVGICKSVSNFWNHVASCVAKLSATYSASAVDSATTACFLLSQLTAPPASINTFPVVECLSSKSPPQSAPENPVTGFSPCNTSMLDLLFS